MTSVVSTPQLVWHRTLPKPAALSLPNQSHIADWNAAHVRRYAPSSNLYRPTSRSHSPTKHILEHQGPETVVTNHGSAEVMAGSPPYEVGHAQGYSGSLDRKRPASRIADDPASISSSPKSVSPVESNNNFCLCQPDSRIPRPRNGMTRL